MHCVQRWPSLWDSAQSLVDRIRDTVSELPSLAINKLNTSLSCEDVEVAGEYIRSSGVQAIDTASSFTLRYVHWLLWTNLAVSVMLEAIDDVRSPHLLRQ